MNRYTYLLLSGLILTGCSEPEVPKRHYQEIVVEAPPPVEQAMHHDPHPSMTDIPLPAQPRLPEAPPFTWDTPDGWTEEPGVGMRLATLRIDTDTEQAECTLIVLGGDAGGLTANIVRWMEQVHIAPPSDYALRTYVDGLDRLQTEGGLAGVVIDFDEFVDDPAALSTLAGIIERGRETVFVKLTGSKGLLARERDNFIQLCKSIR